MQDMEQHPAQEQVQPMQVLVIGGCGFLGRHLVEALHDKERLPLGRKVHVHVACSESDVKPPGGASYHVGDITEVEFIRELLNGRTRILEGPQVIFNTLSEEPKLGFAIDTPGPHYYKRNYTTTSLLLEEARQSPFVSAFVQSSSVAVVRFGQHDEILATEEDAQFVDLTDFPTSSQSVEGRTYMDTKAAADRMVLEYNNPLSLGTCCLRLPALYGPGDSNITIPLIEHKFRSTFLGKDKMFDPLYVGNAVEAHMLAAKALMSSHSQRGPKVAGEAFFITDGKPMPFGQFAKEFQTAASAIKSGTIFGRISAVTDKAHLGESNEEKYMSRFVVDWVDYSRTYSVDKAKERLKYKPIETAEGIKSSVAWAMGPLRKVEKRVQKDQKKLEKLQKKPEKKDKEKATRSRKLFESGKIPEAERVEDSVEESVKESVPESALEQSTVEF